MNDSIRVFVPVGREPAPKHSAPAAGRRTSTATLVVGLLDNHKHNTGAILDRLQQRLTLNYDQIRFVRAQKPDAGKGATPKIIDELAADCQVVINGIGD